MATAQTELDRMPADLRERGWKLEEKRVNDGEPEYVARNTNLGIATESYPVPFTAIAAARKLDPSLSAYLKTTGQDGDEPKLSITFTDDKPIVMDLAIEKIRIDGGTQPRAAIDEATVDRFAEDKRNGAVFPPARVFFDGENFWLSRGFHRRAADIKNGSTTLFSEVRPGKLRDAILDSLGSNATHGLPRTNAEKRNAVLTMLKDAEWSEWSDNAIAEQIKVSQPFVSSLRRDLTKNVLSEHAEATPAISTTTTTKRRGRDGVVRETKNIGRTARESEPHGDDDVIPAETDIRVDDEPEPTERSTEPQQQPAPTTDADLALWNEGMIDLHIRFKADATAPDSIIVSAKHTQTPTPVFKQFLAADLNPRPPALRWIVRELMEAFDNRGKSQPAAKKPKRIEARGKKKATKRPIKPATKKRKPKPATKKKPPPRPKTKPKARKK